MCEGMEAAWLEQSAAKSSLSWDTHLGGHFQAWPGLSVSSAVILKNKKNISKTGILKIETSLGQNQDVHLPRDPLSKKFLMEVLYLAAIQLAKCSAIHYNIKFSLKKPHFLKLQCRGFCSLSDNPCCVFLSLLSLTLWCGNELIRRPMQEGERGAKGSLPVGLEAQANAKLFLLHRFLWILIKSL